MLGQEIALLLYFKRDVSRLPFPFSASAEPLTVLIRYHESTKVYSRLKSRLYTLVPQAGVEPATISLGRIYSIQLSYQGIGIFDIEGTSGCRATG